MKERTKLSLSGLRVGSPQALGAIRLIPLLRDSIPGDLRIRVREYGSAPSLVGLDGCVGSPGLMYTSYIPHGLVVSHTNDGTEATFGTSLGEQKGAKGGVRLLHRMVKREDDEAGSRFRMLPLHLAMEGFLALHFNGPDILWQEYAQQAVRWGLDPRVEYSARGSWVRGFEDALRVFEVHPAQVGVMIFVAEALASIAVVSHPDDYRRMHRSLIEDFFGELMVEYALLYPDTLRIETTIDVGRVATLAELRAEVERTRHEWAAYAELLTGGMFGRDVHVECVRRLKPFVLERFVPDFNPNEECHIGERIVRHDGTVEYMKTFRLSAAQVRRAHLLGQLSAASWNLEAAAAGMKCTLDELIRRITNAGFGYLLKANVLAAAGLLSTGHNARR